jgi:oxygen-dependent protoporphyrinogen oxidase
MVENGIATVTDASHQRDRPLHIAIVGGGITGLAAAYYLTKKSRAAGVPLSYTLLEASPNLGGKIVSERAGGFLVEGGPDCFLTRKPWALSLCRELGLESDLLGTNEARRKVYVLNGGRLHPLPAGVMLIVPTQFLPFATSRLISIPGKLRMAMDLFIPPRREDGDETLASFVRRRLGDEALDKIAEPLLSGIHVSDPERLSLKSSFPRLMEVERKYGSLIRGMLAARRAMHQSSNGSRPRLPMFMSLRGGMQQLVDAVVARLEPTALRVNRPVETVRHTGASEPGYQVHLQGGEVLEADAVIMATPADVSGRLLQELDVGLAAELGRMRYVSTAVVSLGYRPQAGLPNLKGFGFIIPKSEDRLISACTWSSTKFDYRAPEGHSLVRCFMGGPANEAMAELDDAAMTQVVRQELADIMGLHAEPDVVRIYRWHKVNPQYDLGHLDRVAHMREHVAQHSGLFLAGSSYDGVGVPDCVRQGKEAAEGVLETVIQV